MENKKPSLFSRIRPYLKGFQLPLALALVKHYYSLWAK